MKRYGDKYTRILHAAVKVFARKGFYNAKVSEIAREAQVADGTIYLYFENKDDILISLFEVEMEKILAGMRDELAQTTDPVEKIYRFARVHLRLVELHKDLAEVIQVETRQSSKFMKEYKNEGFLEYLNLVGDIVKEGQETGVFRKDLNPSISKRAFFGALDEVSRYWVLSSRKPFSPQAAAGQIAQLFVDGLRPHPETHRNAVSAETSAPVPEVETGSARGRTV